MDADDFNVEAAVRLLIARVDRLERTMEALLASPLFRPPGEATTAIDDRFRRANEVFGGDPGAR